MDKSLQELENELKRLTPRRPSADFGAGLRRQLEATKVDGEIVSANLGEKPLSWRWIAWSLAAAAAIALVAISRFTPAPVEPARSSAATTVAVNRTTPPTLEPVRRANRYEPVQATSVLYDLKEDGTTVLADRTEGRQVRYRYVDTYTWKNPTTNASLRWSVPRDEVRVIPASLD